MGSSFSMVGGGMSPEDVCAICTEAGPDEDTGLEQVLICPNGHYAHVDCVSLWYAQADKCPECRVVVRDFPLWKEINPPPPDIPVLPGAPAPAAPLPTGNILADFDNNEGFEPSYDFSDHEQSIIANRNFMNMRDENDYDTALEYFYSDEGEAYVKYLIDEDMRQYEYLINVDEEDPENVIMNSLMYSIVRDGKMNVAEALYDYARRNDLLEDLLEYSGAIINKFVDNFNYDRDQEILSWLWSRDFNVGFGFLENAALEARNADAVHWYLIHVQPNIGDEELIELFDTLRSDMEDEDYNMTDEQNEIYALLERYLNTDMQAQQTGGGMWQRGGFFMTCS
jgi:hypothetical protein